MLPPFRDFHWGLLGEEDVAQDKRWQERTGWALEWSNYAAEKGSVKVVLHFFDICESSYFVVLLLGLYLQDVDHPHRSTDIRDGHWVSRR